MADFNPDQYLAEKSGDASGFNPDAYLAQKANTTTAVGAAGRGALNSTPLLMMLVRLREPWPH